MLMHLQGGVENVDEAVALAQAITSGCPNLTLTGLMTIGNADYTAGPDNFSCLNTCRAAVAAALEGAVLTCSPVCRQCSNILLEIQPDIFVCRFSRRVVFGAFYGHVW